MKKRYAALGLFAALCASCLPVPFDLAINQASATAAKMTRDNSGLITAGSSQQGSQHDFVFYPQVLATGGFDYSAGFVAAMDSLALDIQAVANGAPYGSFQKGIPNPDPHAPAYVAWPVKSGTSFLFGVAFDALYPQAFNGYGLIQGDPVAHILNMMLTPSFQSLVPSLGSTPTLIGASVAASANAGFDVLHLLGMNGANFQEVSCQLQSTGLLAPTFPRGGPYTLSFIPSSVTRVMYFYDDNQPGDPSRMPNRSFASWYDTSSGSWVSYAWDSLTIYKALPVNHRLDALLSTGQLLSTEGGTGRLYDRDGNLLATFPLGNLAYIGEEYVNGVSRSYFSQCLPFDNTLHFNVYWIQTDQLSTLAH
jgi:hypothetical protein